MTISNGEVFILNTKGLTYVFHVDKTGLLLHDYFGKKIDIKDIKLMKLCKFAVTNNFLNQNLCHNILKVYLDGLDEDNIVKILSELGADNKFIERFLENFYLDDNNNNAYNLE